MNSVTLMGRATRDAEVKQSGETTIARYTLAVDRMVKKDGQQNADFISCVCFGKAAEFAGKHIKKGTKIAVTGRIQTGSYTNQQGVKVYTTDVVVNQHYFCERRQEEPNDGFVNVPEGSPEELPFE